jgi:5S rRNA maturation endonuclease (ribonuclease M5)
MTNSLSLEAVANALGGDISETSNRVLAPGPNHSEKDRSLAVTLDASAPDGFLVHSFAGDDPIACKDYVRKRLGLPEWTPKGGTPAIEYVYHDAHGQPYLKVKRIDKPDGRKIYPQYRWTGSTWAKGKPKGPKIPYRLSKLIKADEVFVVEGEKCADRLANVGLVATTASEGAGKWTKDLNQWFAGKRVFVLPDDDEPGIKHATDVVRHLSGVAREVRLVRLSSLPEKGDVADWLDAGGNAEKLRALCEAEPVVRAAPPPPPSNFEHTGKGIVQNSQANIRLALGMLGATLRHDVFEDRLLIDGVAGVGPLLDDRAMEHLWLAIDEQFGFRPQREFFLTVLVNMARRNAFHPVCNYLDGLKWDGVPRIDTWLTTYAGAVDTPYVSAVGTLMLVAAVRRVRHPGSKFDELPVLESPQGTNKSSALALLAVHDDWFSDDMPLGVEGKRVIEALAGRWIVEAAELKGMRKGEVESLKAFLSRRIDRARMSYGRLVTEARRQCVIVGTTNSTEYLRDNTGNRRFWPVKIEGFELEALRRDRDQLWAEAAAREAAGASIRLDRALWPAAAAEQQARTVEDPFVEVIGQVLRDLQGRVRAHDVWEILGVPAGQRTQDHNARMGEAMRELGFVRSKHVQRFGKDRDRVYTRGDSSARILVSRDGEHGAFYASSTAAAPPPGEELDL